MDVRAMHPGEIDAAVSVWREANVARGAPHGPERTARIRAKLSAPDAVPFVAFRPEIVGMALAEPGRFDTAQETSIRRSCTSRWFSFVPLHSAKESDSLLSCMSSTSHGRAATDEWAFGRRRRTARLANFTSELG